MSIEQQPEVHVGERQNYPELQKAREQLLERLANWRGSEDDRLRLEKGVEAIDWMLEKGNK